MRSMHSSERIEEMVTELEGYRWDAILLSETWRHDKSEIWETHHKHKFMGAGKYDNKHGVGIMLNKKWTQIINDTEYINERAITATIVVNRQRIKLMNVYFPPLGICGPSHRKNVQNDREAHNKLQKIHTYCWRRLQCRTGYWSRNHIHSTRENKRGDWMKHCLMLQEYTALNTMYSKTPQKQTTFISPKGNEKQIDYIFNQEKITSDTTKTPKPTT